MGRESLVFFVEKIETHYGEDPWNAESYKVTGHFTARGLRQTVEVWSASDKWQFLQAHVNSGVTRPSPVKAEITFDVEDRSIDPIAPVVRISGHNGRKVVTKYVRLATTPIEACRAALAAIEGSAATDFGDVAKLSADGRGEWVQALEALREAIHGR